MRGCNGAGRLFCIDRAVMCYEYVELIQRHAPKVATPGGVTRTDAILGGVIDTVLHEAGHGVIKEVLRYPGARARGGRGGLFLGLHSVAVSARGREAPDRGCRVHDGQRGARGAWKRR